MTSEIDLSEMDGSGGGMAPLNLSALVAGTDPVTEAIEATLSRVQTPIVRPGTATFLYAGEAEGVDLLQWITGIDRSPMRPLGSGNLWAIEIPTEDEGRFEYKLAVRRNGHEEWILDPRNPHRAGDPFGENSVCLTWGYARPDWSKPQGAPAGRIETMEVESAVFGTTRTEQVYVPPGDVPEGGYPLAIIHDGAEFDTYGSLTVSLDNLIAAGDIPPLLAVLSQADDRMDEYPRGRRHARFVVEELLPAVTARHDVSESPSDRVLIGASLGAVASLSVAFRYPGLFGGLVLKSGTFILDDTKLDTRPHPVFQRAARLAAAMRRAPDLPPTRAFVHTGELEGLADQSRAMADMLEEGGVEVLYKSTWDGHHWHNWRDQLRDGLMWALGR